MDRHPHRWAWLPAVYSPLLGQLVPDSQGRLHRTLRHLLQRLWQAKYRRERRGRRLDEEATESLNLLCDGLVPAHGQRPGVSTRGVRLHGLWPRHIERQHHDRLLLPGRCQRQTSRTGGAATLYRRWPDGFLFSTVVGWDQLLHAWTSNSILAYAIA
jgi:hypothetical protein